mmetsp:Transcript_23143/g.66426  ORF Transcript_23143/g.66426 Transcript_23143/m.66426 type:complete len:201 (-) Transcript_23143:364-966(-)
MAPPRRRSRAPAGPSRSSPRRSQKRNRRRRFAGGPRRSNCSTHFWRASTATRRLRRGSAPTPRCARSSRRRCRAGSRRSGSGTRRASGGCRWSNSGSRNSILRTPRCRAATMHCPRRPTRGLRGIGRRAAWRRIAGRRRPLTGPPRPGSKTGVGSSAGGGHATAAAVSAPMAVPARGSLRCPGSAASAAGAPPRRRVRSR